MLAVAAVLSSLVGRPARAVVISEIGYHSAALDDGPDEFIELYNENLDPLDLSGYYLCDGVDFVFPRGTFLEGKSFLVVAANANHIRAVHEIDNVLGDWFGSLRNGGERVRLCSPGGAVVAEVEYNDRGKWPVGADGTGHTLELRSPYVDLDDADNWRLSADLGGSPGVSNGPSFETGGGFEPPSSGMDAQGFIVTWLMLGPYTGSGCNVGDAALTADWLRESGLGGTRQTALVWEDGQVVDTDYGLARSTGLHPNSRTAVPTIEDFASFGDTIDLDQAVWPPNPDQVMAYSFVYIDNVTGSDLNVDFGVASDDAIHVLVNGVTAHVNDVCRGVGGSGEIQDRFPVTLEPGKNTVAVKVFEQGGGWSFRLRVEARGTGSPLTSNSQIQITTDPNAGMDFDGGGDPIEPPGEDPPNPGDPGSEPDASPVVINEGLLLSGGEAWIELHNRTGATIDLAGWHITDDPADLVKTTLPAGTVVPARGHIVLTETDLGLALSVAAPGERVFVALSEPDGARVADAYNFEPEFDGFSEARVPDGDSEFEGAADPTPGAPNSMSVEESVVINEVLYHPIDDEAGKEFIELFNRGDSAVDMTGWAFTRGVDFAFPDGTVIEPGDYLVVARDPSLVESTHGLPAGSVLGPAQDAASLDDYGRLRDRGERVTLKDHMGRTVDTVRIEDGGEWPRWADGLGSSVELIDPFQDNRFGQAWDASDDSEKAAPETYSYIGRHGGGESELHIALLTRGITVVDDVSIVGGGVQNIDEDLIASGEVWRFLRGDAPPPADWADLDFDDASWESGPTGIGYGDNDDATVLDDMQGSYVTVFCRREFFVDDLDAIDDLILSVVIDDGFYAYLNGVQVTSFNVSSPDWDASAANAGEPSLQDRDISASKPLLRSGRNVLAVQVHNAGLGSSDLSFDPRLVSRRVEFLEGSEQLVNGDFESDARGWIIEGTHIRSGRTTVDPITGSGSLKVIASGRGDNKVNRIETPEANGFGLAELTPGEDLQISFTARWVVGSQSLLTHGYRHSMAKSHALGVPENLGTPGRINSVTLRQIDRVGSANLGPVITDVVHDPAVPGGGEDVRVYARVHDADGVANVRLRYSLGDASATPSTVTMTRVSGDVFSATVPGRPLGTKVVFWITAEDEAGLPGRYPVDVTERTHPLLLDASSASPVEHRNLIYRHTERVPSTPYHSYRFWMTDADETRLRSRRQQSNDLIPGSFVFGGSKVYHEAATRFAGSPFARGGIGGSYRVALPRGEPLHGRFRKFNLDNHHGSGSNARERISHYLIRYNQGATTVPYSDTQALVRWQMNDATTQIIEQVWVPDVQFLSRWYPNDDEGDLFEMDDRFVIDDSGNRAGSTDGRVLYPPPSSTSDGDGENKENYRWFFGLRSKNGADDFSRLIDFARLMDPGATGTAAFDDQVWDAVDVEQMLRIWTIRHSTDDWDTWGANRGKNCYLYCPTVDGRVKLFAWDMELTYGNPGSFLIPDNPSSTFSPGGFGEVHRLLGRPKVKRMYYAILDEMVNGPESFFHSDHLRPYMDRLAAMGMSNTQIGQPGGFIDQRAALIRPRIAPVMDVTFRITTNGGAAMTIDESTVDIAGEGPASACQILVDGEPYEPSFSNMTAWRVDGVFVPPGAHTLTFLAFDLRGAIVGTDTIQITNTDTQWEPPAVTSVSPSEASPGADVEILGVGFRDRLQVLFGGVAALEVTFDEGVDPGRIIARVPGGGGVVDVIVRNIDGQESEPVAFTVIPPPATFVRGDTNGDGRLDVSDAVKGLLHLFGGVPIDCEDAADVDDDEAITVTDAVRTLDWLFRSGPAPAAPFPSPGEDPEGDGLGCDR